MLSPPTVQMTRCPVCDATGKTGTTLGFGGTICALCHGTCYLRTEPNPCPCCDANGGFPSLFGLRWDTCRLCHGVKYLMDKPLPCPKCRATGQIRGMGGLFSTPCDLCDRQCYIRKPHGRCIKCNFSSFLANYFIKCINCNGIRRVLISVPQPQHLCPRCNSTGRFRGQSCTLCGGNGVIHHEVASCAKCGGAGEIKRTLSLLRGNQSCPTCLGQGYFTVFGGSISPAPPQKRKKGKRGRGSDDEGDDESSDGRAGHKVLGGSDPRPRGRRSNRRAGNHRPSVSRADQATRRRERLKPKATEVREFSVRGWRGRPEPRKGSAGGWVSDLRLRFGLGGGLISSTAMLASSALSIFERAPPRACGRRSRVMATIFQADGHRLVLVYL
ncbi:unnamed protein product [Pylaiella littoralis]